MPNCTFRVLLMMGMIVALVWTGRPQIGMAQDGSRGQRVVVRNTAGQTRELYSESYALVIGVSDYAHWSDLPGVKDDVPEIRAVLERHGFRVTVVMSPTRSLFNEALGNFLADYGQGRENRLLIYFAGHGHTLKTSYGQDNRLGYLVPADAPLPIEADSRSIGAFKRLAFSMSEINTYAENIEAKHVMFVLDSCFSGALFKARGDAVPDSISARTEEPVRQFITAGTEKQRVPDRSYFRRVFVEALAGEGDLDKDGYVTGSELGYYIQKRVVDYTRKAQTPQYGKIIYPDLDKGDLVFVSPKKAPPTPPNPAPRPVGDRCAIAWDSIWNSESEQTIESFLVVCKDSPQAFAANLRLGDLRARRQPDPPASVNPAPPALTPLISLPRGVPAGALRAAPFTSASVDANGRVTRQQNDPVHFYQEDLGNGVSLEMVAVPGGRFQMGSPATESGRDSDETQHWVRVGDFWIGRYEVTQRQWKAVMGGLPPNMADLGNEFKGDDLPVVRVSWEEAQAFIQKLNTRLNGANYRLLREAEWEFAARAGKSTPFGFGATITPGLENYYWDNPYGNAPKKTYMGHPDKVGSYMPNSLGLFDIHGNVWEWCEDWYGPYPTIEMTDPKGSSSGTDRVLRGGGWNSLAVNCRSANRFVGAPSARDFNLGFRLSRSVASPTLTPSQESKTVNQQLSEGVLLGNAITKVAPIYPETARQINASGEVKVQVTIGEDGRVIEAVAVSGHPILRLAAEDAARKWVFKPATHNGKPIQTQGTLTFLFERPQ